MSLIYLKYAVYAQFLADSINSQQKLPPSLDQVNIHKKPRHELGINPQDLL